jgi:hypothetical protein
MQPGERQLADIRLHIWTVSIPVDPRPRRSGLASMKRIEGAEIATAASGKRTSTHTTWNPRGMPVRGVTMGGRPDDIWLDPRRFTFGTGSRWD